MDVRIIARHPESNKDFGHRETIKKLSRMGFNIRMEDSLDAKMVLTDNKEL